VYAEDVQYIKGSTNTYADEKKGTTSGHANVKAYGTPHKPATVSLASTSCIGEHCKEKKKEQEPYKRLLLAAAPAKHKPVKWDRHTPPKKEHKPAPKQSESTCPAQHLDCGWLLVLWDSVPAGNRTGPFWQGWFAAAQLRSERLRP
jgi:hypothetical protein